MQKYDEFDKIQNCVKKMGKKKYGCFYNRTYIDLNLPVEPLFFIEIARLLF